MWNARLSGAGSHVLHVHGGPVRGLLWELRNVCSHWHEVIWVALKKMKKKQRWGEVLSPLQQRRFWGTAFPHLEARTLAPQAWLPISGEGRSIELMKRSILLSTGHRRLCQQGPLKSVMLCDFHFWLPLCASVITL